MPTSVPNPSSNPAFEARRLTTAFGWYVRVAWLNGQAGAYSWLRLEAGSAALD
jgi:hypothetical protein